MLKLHFVAGLAASALIAGAALAQQSPAPAQNQGSAASAGTGQFMTQMQPNMMRASQLVGIDVYGSDNQKIGDVDEVLVDRDGKIQAVIVGVGGFLGIGQKDVAIPYNQVQWMSDEQARAASGQATGTNTAGGVATPTNPGAGGTASGGQPATTGSTGTTGATGTAGAADDGVPDRAVVRMSKADLQNAPEFRYSANEGNRTGAAGNTNPPPSNVNRPGNAPQQ